MAGGEGAAGCEGGAYGGGDGFTDAMAVVEADFFFGGVDIHVEAVRVHVEEEEGHGVLTLHEGGVVAFAETVGDGGAFDGTTVEEGELHLPGGAAEASAADEALDADAEAFGGRDFDEACGEFGAGQAADAFEEVLSGGEVKHEFAVARQGERGAGIGDGVEAELLFDVRVLGGFGTEEFAAGGEVEEEVSDFNDGAVGIAAVANVDEFAAVDFDLGAGEGVGLFGGEAETRDAGDAGEGFAAEAEGVDGGEVFFGADFAGGVAFEAEHSVFAIHAGAIVDDFDEGGAAALDVDFDVEGTSIEAVFDQFANDGSGAFNDLTGGHLAGEGVGEDADARHGKGE